MKWPWSWRQVWQLFYTTALANFYTHYFNLILALYTIEKEKLSRCRWSNLSPTKTDLRQASVFLTARRPPCQKCFYSVLSKSWFLNEICIYQLLSNEAILNDGWPDAGHVLPRCRVGPRFKWRGSSVVINASPVTAFAHPMKKICASPETQACSQNGVLLTTLLLSYEDRQIPDDRTVQFRKNNLE